MKRWESVLIVLSDGLWHKTMSFLTPACGSEGLKRLRELRQRGLPIEARRIEGSAQWEYRLKTKAWKVTK